MNNKLEQIRTWSTVATLVVSLVVMAMVWSSDGGVNLGG